MTPDQYCQQRAAPGGSSTHYSLLFLDPERRRALCALVAFRRELEDLVNDTGDENAARIKLAWWRHEIGELFRGDPQHLVTRAISPGIAPFGITHERLDGVIEGKERDLMQTRYLDFAGLESYCHLVSGLVVACASDVLDKTRSTRLDYLRDLGLALQLTSIIRNVGEDARRGRVYLPVNELQQFGVPVADILNARTSDNFIRLMQFQVERASDLFEKALAVLQPADRKAQRPLLIFTAIQRALLDEIRADGFRVLQQRLSLTPIRKLWLACKVRAGT